MLVALSLVAHLLVFAYWLGGDLGAFYTSAYVTDAKRSRGERLLALKVLSDLDMAPRTALILTLPTGLTLAWLKGWLATPPLAVVAAWILGLGWLALAWRIHLRHSAPANLDRRADLIIRWLVLVALAAAGLAILLTRTAPLFLGAKMLLLAGCVLLGLAIRAVMAPLGPAIAALAGPSGPTPESDQVIHATLARARPLVVCLWALLIAAALFGAAKPV
jgi:hypothetical protein